VGVGFGAFVGAGFSLALRGAGAFWTFFTTCSSSSAARLGHGAAAHRGIT
jgi:hypothetical protein